MEDDSGTRELSDESPSEEESSSYVVSSNAEDSSTSWSASDGSESSVFETTRGKKRRKLEPLPPPSRPDNVQTRKLRPPQHLRQPKEPTPVPSSETSLSSPEPEMVRELSEEDAERDVFVVRGMWEMTAVFHFLQSFHGPLQLVMDVIKMEDVEQAIVKSNGQGFLARVHIDLMKGMKPRLGADESNWTTVLARKLRSECRDPKDNPFNPVRGNEAFEYCNAPAEKRVLVLKLLCDIRCCENDVREIFDDCLKPKPRTETGARKRNKKKDVSKMNLLRKMPLGQLNATTVFWYFDTPEDLEFRLYRETREHVKRHGKARGYTRVKSWELVACNVDQLSQFGEELPSSGTHCKNLRKKILDELVPRLQKQIEREERKLKAAEKMRKYECNIILDSHGGYGRSARNRTEAKYTFEEYERAMAEAIDEGKLRRGKVEDNGNDEMFMPDDGDDVDYGHDAMSMVEDASMDDEASMPDEDMVLPDNDLSNRFNVATDRAKFM